MAIFGIAYSRLLGLLEEMEKCRCICKDLTQACVVSGHTLLRIGARCQMLWGIISVAT